MKFGYARVSTKDQHLDLQISALEQAGCDTIYKEYVSGAKQDRPELKRMMAALRKGDTVIIWKIDRIGRSLKHLVSLVETFLENGVNLISLNDPIDTSTASGRFTFNIFAALAEFEREIISERTLAGQYEAWKKGRQKGRPVGLSEKNFRKSELVLSLYNMDYSITQIAEDLNIGRTTVYRYLKHRGVAIKKTG